MIAFTERDLQRFQVPHNDALVVTVQIGTQDVRRARVDQGSSAEVMYYSLFKQLKIPETDFLPIEVFSLASTELLATLLGYSTCQRGFGHVKH